MKKFRFTLQRLLDIREAREKEVKNELMKVLSQQNRERVFQEELQAKVRKFETEQREKSLKGIFSPADTLNLMRFADVSRNAVIESQRRIEELQPEVDRIRAKLVEASREKKVVEKLKERKLAEYDYELNRETARENDDMNQKLYHRKLM